VTLLVYGRGLNKGEHSNALTRQKLGVSASDDKAATVTYGQYCGFRSSGVPFTSAHRQNCYTDFGVFRKCHDPNGIRTRVTAVEGRQKRVALAKVNLHKIEQPTTHLFFVRATGERLLIIGLRR
jgi:hypothetical protein